MIYATDFSANLAEVLANHLVQKSAQNPFNLAKTIVILPTRRSCLALKEAFFDLDKDILLPQMIPLYEMEKHDVDTVPALPCWERLFLLTKLCQAKPNLHEITKAFQVANSLAELMDLAYQYQVDLSHINDLIPTDSFAKHWQETVQFLDIIQKTWPQILKERNQMDSQERLQCLIRSYAKKITPDTPVVIAGLTGDLPAVLELMKSIIQNGGEIFLDGVDYTFLTSNQQCNTTHPQFLIYNTLKQLKIPPQQVHMITGKVPHEEFVEQAFRQESWQKSDMKEKDIQNISYIQCDTSEIEALTIALQLRKILEQPNQTGCLVTPDRTLARRVICHMHRWSIEVDDSAGIPLKHTPIGSFLILINQLAQNPSDPQNQLGLYKHPLFADGKNAGLFHIMVKNEEKKARKSDSNLTLSLSESGKEFFDLIQTPHLTSLRKLVNMHLKLAEQWARTDTETGAKRLWQNDCGKEFLVLIEDILTYADILEKIDSSEYPVFFQNLIANKNIHSKYGMNARLKILGPIEARFFHTDVCILGGLNEQVFPPISDVSPWVNRPMRSKLGLPDSERKITIMAHDFMHACASSKVILTRALKNAGTPTIPSRFIERLQVLAQINGFDLKTYHPNLASLLDTPEKQEKGIRPSPCPPVTVRPTELSVSNIEQLKRNPYAIYAKYILNLRPLNDLGAPNKAIIYGNVVHEVLSEFLKKDGEALGKSDLMIAFKKGISKTVLSIPDQIFYTGQFEQIISFFLTEQKEAQSNHIQSITEVQGKITLKQTKRPFTLTARADRIDISKNFPAKIIDYKTGNPPSFNEVLSGNSPQLSLEALILSKGGFEGIPSQEIDDLQYWYLGRHPKKASFKSSKSAPDNFNFFLQQTEKGLTDLVQTFESPKTHYEVCPVAQNSPKFNDYEHLARTQEWSKADDEGESDGSE